MNFSSLITLGIIFISLLSCGTKVQTEKRENYLDQNALYQIFLDGNEKSIETDFFEIFELADVVPLEFVEGEYLASVFRAEFYKDKYYLLDSDFHHLMVFSENGKFISRIGHFGSGPEEIADITDFALDRVNQRLVLLSIEEKAMVFYDLNGNFLKKEKLSEQADQLAINNEGSIGISITYFNPEFKNFRFTNSTDQESQLLFPYPSGTFPILLKFISGHVTTDFTGKSLLFHEPASSQIYDISQEGEVMKKYSFNDGKNLWEENKRHELNEFFLALSQGKITFLSRLFEEWNHGLVFKVNKKVDESARIIIDPRFGVFDSRTGFTKFSQKDSRLQELVMPIGVNKDLVYGYMSFYDFYKLVEAEAINISAELRSKIQGTFERGDYDTPVLLGFKIKNY